MQGKTKMRINIIKQLFWTHFFLFRSIQWCHQAFQQCTPTRLPAAHTRYDQRLRDRRPSTAACPACWAMGTKELKLCTARKKRFLYWADKGSQDRTKISCTGTTSPTNQPRKDLFYCPLWVPIHLSFNSQQGPPLVSLGSRMCKLCTSIYKTSGTSMNVWMSTEKVVTMVF